MNTVCWQQRDDSNSKKKITRENFLNSLIFFALETNSFQALEPLPSSFPTLPDEGLCNYIYRRGSWTCVKSWILRILNFITCWPSGVLLRRKSEGSKRRYILFFPKSSTLPFRNKVGDKSHYALFFFFFFFFSLHTSNFFFLDKYKETDTQMYKRFLKSFIWIDP